MTLMVVVSIHANYLPFLLGVSFPILNARHAELLARHIEGGAPNDRDRSATAPNCEGFGQSADLEALDGNRSTSASNLQPYSISIQQPCSSITFDGTVRRRFVAPTPGPAPDLMLMRPSRPSH